MKHFPRKRQLQVYEHNENNRIMYEEYFYVVSFSLFLHLCFVINGKEKLSSIFIQRFFSIKNLPESLSLF